MQKQPQILQDLSDAINVIRALQSQYDALFDAAGELLNPNLAGREESLSRRLREAINDARWIELQARLNS